jgi:hypothetical protein
MYGNLRGPSRLLAVCATVLLIASTFLGAEAAIMIILGAARNIVLRPFLLLGYVEACAMFFSILGIVAAIIGIVFYRPYCYLSEMIYRYRMNRAAHANDQPARLEQLRPAPVAYSYNPEEDGIPD